MTTKIESLIEDIQDKMEWTLTLAEKLGATSAEVHGTVFKMMKFIKMGEKPDFSAGILQGLSIRIISNESIGFTYVTSLTNDAIEQAVKNAMSQAGASNQQIGSLEFPEPRPSKMPSMPFDSELYHVTPDTAADIYEQVTLNKDDPRLPKDMFPLGGGAFFYTLDAFLLNSSGIQVSVKNAYCFIGAAFLSFKGFPAFDGAFKGFHYLKEINPEQVIDTAISKVNSVAAPKTMNLQGPRPVILHPDAIGTSFFGNLLPLLTDMFQADNVYNASTPYSKEDIGKEIASTQLTLVDDPWQPNLMGTNPFDGEGVPTMPTPIIENGILTDFYLDHLHAHRLNMENNGKSSRYSDPATATTTFLPPSIKPTNTIIKSGDASLEEIIAETREGFMVNSVMGVHMSDFSTGRFSVGASGWYIKNGEIKFPVQELTINGTMPRLLKDIDLISKEQETGTNAIVPYIRTRQLQCIAVKRPLFMRIGFNIYKILLRLGIVKHPFLS